MKFVVSYSCGKDSTLALHKMLAQGHKPVGLLVTINQELERSWFHGVDLELLEEISRSLGIPLILCRCTGEQYHTALEEGLRQAREQGAEAAVFGDIDIEEHAAWCRERCDAAGMQAIFPLWKCDRRENTEEVIRLGYHCLIKCVNNSALPKSMLGKPLDRQIVKEMEERGIDVCGENGEYHTIVVDGPIFRFPVPFVCKEVLDFGRISAINICASKS